MIIDQFLNTASKLNQRSANLPNVSFFEYLVMTFTINLHFDNLRVIIDGEFKTLLLMTIYQILQLYP